MTAEICDIVDLDTEPERYRPDGKTAPRWRPDLQLVPAILMTPKWHTPLVDYDENDRCWIVAGITIADWSANEIEHRIGGSIRLIRDIRSKPLTSLCMFMQEELEKLETDLRVERISHAATQKALDGEIRAAGRLKTQLDQMIRTRQAGPVDNFPCGHPKVKWNTYLQKGTYPSGREFCREFCRECNRARAADYRERRKSAGNKRKSHSRVTIMHPDSVPSR